MKKKFFVALLLASALLFALLTVPAMAEVVQSGTCGQNLEWTLDDKGELVISGTGAMRNYYNDSLWYKNENIKTITIQDGVTTIGEDAFEYCTGLTSITIPDSVTKIGSSAFYKCTGLTRVEISDLKAWCEIEFDYAYSNPLSYAKNLYLNGNLVTNLQIPDSVTTIGSYAFNNCDGLVSITIPDSVTTIGSYAFAYCDGLTSVTIPNSVTTIGSYAFYNCDGLVSITIPDSVTTIGYEAFYSCFGLTRVEISDLKAWCEIEFGDVDSNPLSYAKNLYLNGNLVTNLQIPDSVTTIGRYAFYGCYNLKCVGLSKNVKYIRNDAFASCPNINTVFFEGSKADWDGILFYNRNENLTGANIVYGASKKTYSFVTNCDQKIADITDFAVFASPGVKADGKSITGWYDNPLFEGDAITFPYYGDATVLYAAWTDKTGTSFDDAFVARANGRYTINTTTSNQLVYFEFVPSRSKTYHIYTTGSKDTVGYLYADNKSQLASNDDNGDGNNFCISYSLEKDKKYYIAAKVYNGFGDFVLVIEEPVDYKVNSVTPKDLSGNELSSIPDEKFLATVSISNISSSSDALVVLAAYGASGAFRGLMYIQTEDMPVGSTIKVSIPVDNQDGEIAKLKAFCWDSFASMTPMGDAASFPQD